MTIAEIITKRDIKQVLHFTTNAGLVGTLATRGLKSRHRLPREAYLEFVYSPNCAVRRDVAWLDYANLSITHINCGLFNISSRKWHRDSEKWWCVLSFRPPVLTHEGVVFATTNNMYTGAIRAPGAAGLERLFAPVIHQYADKQVIRANYTPACQPTCQQAEVLYPKELSTEWLSRIYVATDSHADAAQAQASTLSHPDVEVVIDPDMFH